MPLPVQAVSDVNPPVIDSEVNDSSHSSSDDKSGLFHHKGLRQFVKFCIVGASSTIVTFVVLNLCYRYFHLPLFTSLTAAFLLSVMNGFFWNRKWTFKHARGNSARDQSVKFLAVNTVGYFLNTSIVVLVVAHFATSRGILASGPEFRLILFNILSGEGKQHYAPALINGAQLFAIVIVVWWNFFANRRWTFKH